MNLISGNGLNGVRIHGDDGNGGATDNKVEGNIIGLKINGIDPLPNQANGVHIESRQQADSSYENVSANYIGFTVAGTGNLIADNGANGILISGQGATGNKIYGNTIGLNQNGDAAGNTNDGVLIDGGANTNDIGISGDPGRNIISANQVNGVEIRDAGSSANNVKNNVIGASTNGKSPSPTCTMAC